MDVKRIQGLGRQGIKDVELFIHAVLKPDAILIAVGLSPRSRKPIWRDHDIRSRWVKSVFIYPKSGAFYVIHQFFVLAFAPLVNLHQSKYNSKGKKQETGSARPLSSTNQLRAVEEDLGPNLRLVLIWYLDQTERIDFMEKTGYFPSYYREDHFGLWLKPHTSIETPYKQLKFENRAFMQFDSGRKSISRTNWENWTWTFMS